MAAVVPFIPLIATGVGLAGSALMSKSAKQVQPTPRPTRLEARERASERDRLSRRRGTAANSRVGFGAGEAFTGPKKSLLGRES
ncbi:MAG: hypothetical protein CL802_13525 [Citromicrobium sp.]|nr:hypothetical protein [Citromicrobium sp.]|tara:strand:+ start:316 stop:567 length:252 start_codon:yes stop_codon:yes gene_type:complete